MERLTYINKIYNSNLQILDAQVHFTNLYIYVQYAFINIKYIGVHTYIRRYMYRYLCTSYLTFLS